MRDNLTIAVTLKGEIARGLAGAAPAEVERCIMKMSPFEERRSSYRLPFVSSFFCRTIGEDLVVSGRLQNVSITGCYGVLESPLPVGTSCSLHIIFQGDHSRLNVEGIGSTIVRSTAEGIAIRFDQRLEWFVLIPLFYPKLCNKPLPSLENVGDIGGFHTDLFNP